jgi:hypothetical protein
MKFEGKTSDERKEEMRERQKGSKWKQESEHKTTLDVSNFHKDIYFNGEKLGEINSGNLEIAKLPK